MGDWRKAQRGGAAAGTCCLASIAAHALAAPPPAIDPPAILVVGQRPAEQRSIDRETYVVAHDLQSTAGSASDVLRNLPSVDVDASGNVSLRGDPNVQILIDGRPSTAMTAANRGDTLQTLSASTIERVDVITSPSAQYKPDGSAGIINIITRKDGRAGVTGAVQVAAGSDGRLVPGISLGYKTHGIALTGGLNARRERVKRPLTDHRSTIDPATGLRRDSVQNSRFERLRLSRTANAGIDYDATAQDRLSAGYSYNWRSGDPHVVQRDRVTDGSGAVIADFDRIGQGVERESTAQATARYRHAWSGKDHAISIDIRRGQTIERQRRDFVDRYRVPAGLITTDTQRPYSDEIERGATAEYVGPFARGKITAGYDLDAKDDRFRNDDGGAVATRFDYRETVHALYATYEKVFGDTLTSILGLRIEDATIVSRQANLAQRNARHDVHVYPTLNLQYAMADHHMLRLNAGERIVRPQPDDLNPYPTFQDPLNVRAGNPLLQPQRIWSAELGYQFKAAATSWQATAYLRRTDHAFTDVSRLVDQTVLLTTKQNLGHSTSRGLELIGRGRLSPALAYNLSGNLYRVVIDAGRLGLDNRRAATSYGMKANLDLKLSRRDTGQVNGSYSGRILVAQGYRLPGGSVNIGYRHRFDRGPALVLTLVDLFDSLSERTVLDTPTLQDRTRRRNSRRAVTIALSMPIGPRGESETKFDYGN